MMKIGDLVKYTPEMTGLQNCLGIVIGFNGISATVQWAGRAVRSGSIFHAEKLPKHLLGQRAGGWTTELTDFLEVVSEAR